MAPRKQLTRDERLEKKRQAEKLRYQKIKNDPEKYELQKQKDKEKYLKKKEKRIIKTVDQMTPREQRKARKMWKKKARERRQRLALQNVTNVPVTLSISDDDVQIQRENSDRREAVIHMDFSENYLTKYAEEIQAFHFGGSRQQISLHTVVTYTKEEISSEVKTACYCPMSENLSHAPPAIWAHLQPILNSLPSEVEILHFLSDGPGAPDGVGAVYKRLADRLVASGSDITSLSELSNAKDALLVSVKKHIKTIPGTLRVHQVSWNIEDPKKLKMKSLSCFCTNNINCDHFKLGVVIYSSHNISRLRVEDLYGTDLESVQSKKTEYRYVAMFMGLEEDDEIQQYHAAVCEMVGLAKIVFGNAREMTALAKALNLKFDKVAEIPFLLNSSKRVTVGVSSATCSSENWLVDNDIFVMTQGGSAPAIVVWGHGHSVQIQPIVPKMPVIDATGAGDALVAGFLAGVLARWDPKSCLEYGCKAAGMMVTRLGVTLPDVVPTDILL
ncbi:hypothetical protein PV328_008394 [Microctonus aethiopoides]|uniref:Carbohydrate kinase PfkB domain-containing protein n=1 Tax=Microctonus aethiopoides TaxID=144406 RepID=A0AA39FJ54_9HYME|nr:hypothetical protein PV328_008394 [Microctonus aethiopoides]